MPEKNWFHKTLAKLSSLSKEKTTQTYAALDLEQLADGHAVQLDDTPGVVTLTTGEALPDGTAGCELRHHRGQHPQPRPET